MSRAYAILCALAVLAVAACSDEVIRPILDTPEEVEQMEVSPSNSYILDASHLSGSGEDLLRAAIEAANRRSWIRLIRLPRWLGTVEITEPLVYTGSHPLLILGGGATIDASGCDCNALSSIGGGDFRIWDLTIDGAGLSGLYVGVPANARRTAVVHLKRVTVKNAGLHGVHIDDQTGNSAAGIRFFMSDSQILDNGFRPGFSDFDGVRIDEGGYGSIHASLSNVLVTGNAGDGVEFDERGPGDAVASVFESNFDSNGTQPQNLDDLEDGFDIDEADGGSIQVWMLRTTASENSDEGIDLDEAGSGNIVAVLDRVESSGNTDENIKFSEDIDAEDDPEVNPIPSVGDGGILFLFSRVTANGSADDGVQLEEFGVGNLNGRVVHSFFNDNGDDGFEAEQIGPGGGMIRIINVTAEGNDDDPLNIDGVTVNETP